MEILPAGYKFTPSEEFLVGELLSRRRLRGEPLQGAAAARCIWEADVYGDEPERLTSRFAPANRDPCEWFFFSGCKLVKAKNGGHRGRQGKGRRKERTVRWDGRVEIGQWRSTQAVKNVVGVDDSGRGVVIGYHQNFEYRDSKKQKSEWLMEEYGALPPLEDDAGGGGGDDTELVVCKIYKTPAARRADQAKRSAGRRLSPASPIPSPVLPSQRASPQLQPPPFGPSQPAVVPPNQPNPWLSSAPLMQAYWPEQVLQPPLSPAPFPLPYQHDPPPPLLLPWHQPEQLPPPPLPQPDMPQYNIAATTGDAVSDAISFSYDDLVWSDGNQFASDEHRGIIDASAETLQPPPPPAAVVNPHPHAVSAARVGDDRTPAVSQSSECTTTTAMTSEHHADNGGVLPPPDEQQQQPPPPPRPHAELDATARTRPNDLQLLERSAKRRNILGIHSSLFVSSSPCRPTVRRTPTSAR